MNKVGTLKFNTEKSRWEGWFGNKFLLQSADKELVIQRVRQQTCNKARELGIVDLVMDDGAPQETGAAQEVAKPLFTVNERFDFLEAFVQMVATGVSASTIVVGEGGFGKSHTVIKALKAAGLVDNTQVVMQTAGDDVWTTKPRGYVVVKGYSTPKGLYRTLFENRNQIVVFDDCDSVLKNDTAVNVLKAALDSYDERIVTWNAESGPMGDSLPKSFEFTGGVVFISNMSMTSIPQAIISRAPPIDLQMNRNEMLERMEVIAHGVDFMPEYGYIHKQDALIFMREHMFDSVVQRNPNLRSLMNIIKVRATQPADMWEKMAMYALINA